MLITLLIWLYITFLSYTYGSAFLFTYQKITKKTIGNIYTPIIVLIGLSLIAGLGMYLSLFMKLGLWANIILSTGAIALVVSKQYVPARPRIEVSWQYIFWTVLVGLAFVYTLEAATHTPSSSDTSLYHAQAIRWVENYRVVPGLGNLHGRLAFNSSWLLLNALFSFSFFGYGSFHQLSGFIFIVSILFFSQGAYALIKGKPNLLNVSKTLLIPLSFYLLSGDIDSPATDLPATLLVWILLSLLLENLDTPNPNLILYMAIFALGVFAITVKMSTFPVIFILVPYILKLFKELQWKTLGLLFLIAVFIGLPWILRNIFSSGYLVFPFEKLDLFNFDWKIPADQVQTASNAVLGFARIPGQRIVAVVNMSLKQWYPIWFHNQTTNRQITFLLAMFSPLPFFLQLAILRKSIRTRKNLMSRVYLFLSLYAGLAFWFFQAPSFRFGYGFLVGVIIFSYFPVGTFFLGQIEQRIGVIASITIIIGVVFYQAYVLAYSFEKNSFRERLIFPSDYKVPLVEPCPLGEMDVFCAREWNQCNYDAFPCVRHLPPNIISRDGTYQGGFRFSP